MYERRFYRDYIPEEGLINYTVKVMESDLFIASRIDLKKEAEESLIKYRKLIELYGRDNPAFFSSLEPYPLDLKAPLIIQRMMSASSKAGVGPMAAVAGAISEMVGRDLLNLTEEIIIENGGDIFLKSESDRRILIYAGTSPFSERIALKIPACQEAVGICTSAGTVGHSLSFGKADAVVILSPDTFLADAVATAVGNLVKTEEDIQTGIDYARSILGVTGVLIILGSKMGAFGDIQIEKVI